VVSSSSGGVIGGVVFDDKHFCHVRWSPKHVFFLVLSFRQIDSEELSVGDGNYDSHIESANPLLATTACIV